MFLKILCWITVLTLPACSVAYAVMVKRAYSDAARHGLSGIWCGNIVTDPLVLILSYSTPGAIIATAGLGALSLRQFASTVSVVSASMVTVCCTGALVRYGSRFFETSIPGHHLAELVWWMENLFPA